MKKTILTTILLLTLIPTIAFSETNESEIEVDLNELVSNKIEQCEGHFDIKPYILLSHSEGNEKDTQSLDEEQKETIIDFFRTGSITLNKQQQDDTIAVKCAGFAEGYISGSTFSNMLCSFKVHLPNIIGEVTNGVTNGVADEITEKLKESLKDSINQSLESKETHEKNESILKSPISIPQ